MDELTVHHFGPDLTTVGGMASVIRVFTENSVGADRVYAHSSWRPQSPLSTLRLSANSMRALLRLPHPHVAHVHLSERGSFLREGSLVALAHRHRLPTVATLHGASFEAFANRYRRLTTAVLGQADLITCLDRRTLGILRRDVPHVRSVLVPNPVFVEHRFLPADETEELVVFAGEIGLRKGVDVLFRAWELVARRRPEARCLIVGPAGDFAPTRADRLEVLPAVAPAQMKAILQRARVVALPARAEGMPMILTEALSLGRPFVSTPVGGISELTDGGFLVPVGNELDLADRLTELLARPELARSIGERGRQFCLATRSTNVIDARFRELYEEANGALRRHAPGV